MLLHDIEFMFVDEDHLIIKMILNARNKPYSVVKNYMEALTTELKEMETFDSLMKKYNVAVFACYRDNDTINPIINEEIQSNTKQLLDGRDEIIDQFEKAMKVTL